jgi:hypothetical protein
MNPRPFAWTAGAILLIFGIAGFVPPLAPPEQDALRIAARVGGAQLFGLFPVSPVLSALHVALGAWGLWAGSRLGRAFWFARRAVFVFATLLVMGTIPGADTLFGLAPLYGNNLLLHGLLAILCFLFGWLYRRPTASPDGEEEADA